MKRSRTCPFAGPTSRPANWCCAGAAPAQRFCAGVDHRLVAHNIFLDGAVIEHFKAKAGARGYQTLINETLKQAIQAQTLEGVIRKTIREELRRA